MRIAVVGSWRDGRPEWSFRGSHEQFSNACKSIGRLLAPHKHTVVVGGESPSTADFHIVQGILEVAAGAVTPSVGIDVVRPEGDNSSYETLAKEHPQLFTIRQNLEWRWASAHLVAIRDADAVLAIAGMDGTYDCGLAAMVAKKTLVPIASFGGAAGRLLAATERLPGVRELDSIRKLNNPWTEQVGERALSLLTMRPRSLNEASTKQDREFEEVLRDFHREAPYEKSVFVMTKFAEPKRQSERDKKLERVIRTVRRALTVHGYAARLASDRTYNPLLWKNIEVYLRGCERGVAIVENKHTDEINPNVAMEWGWMRAQGKQVLYLLEKDFENTRADFSSFICDRFDWDYPEADIEAAIAQWLSPF